MTGAEQIGEGVGDRGELAEVPHRGSDELTDECHRGVVKSPTGRHQCSVRGGNHSSQYNTPCSLTLTTEAGKPHWFSLHEYLLHSTTRHSNPKEMVRRGARSNARSNAGQGDRHRW